MARNDIDGQKSPDSMSVPPVVTRPGPSAASGRLLVIGVVLSGLLLALSIWLTLRAEPGPALSAHPAHGAASFTGHL